MKYSLSVIGLAVSVSVMFMLLFSGAVLASDINNPVNCYSVVFTDRDTGERDSVLLGKILFDPLPEYRRETRVSIEYYARASFPTGLVIRVNGPVLDAHGLLKLAAVTRIEAPIEKGDTVRTEFLIAPQQIGIVTWDFLAYPPESDRPLLVTPFHKTVNLLLAPEGHTIALASSEADFRRASVLGPVLDLLPRGLTFTSIPTSVGGQGRLGVAFDVLVDVSRSDQSANELLLNCKVWPLHNFQPGIGFHVRHPDAVSISDLSESIVGPVDSGALYQFSLGATVSEPGIHALQVLFETMNPDYRKEEGLFSRVKSQTVARGISIYLGVDDAGQLTFITNREPRTSYEVIEKYGADPTDIDSRYSLLITVPRSRRASAATGFGYERIIQKVRQGPKGFFKKK